MAEPMMIAQDVSALPDPTSQAGNRLVELGGDAARRIAEQRIRRFVKSYVPKMFHPLIPGERGSVAGNAQKSLSRWFWGLVTSAVISVVFFAVFAVAFLGFALVTAYAVVTSM